MSPDGSMETLSVIIPVYNEEATIEEIIRRVEKAPTDGLRKEIIVVDDGSTDDTPRRLSRLEASIAVIRHPRRQGKGAAVRSGFQAATGDLLLIQDADLEYDPSDYPALLAPLLKGTADAVIGSRFLLEQLRFFTKDSPPFFFHYVGNQVIRWLTNTLYGMRATDYEGGYKAFTRQAVAQTAVRTNGFDFDNELICKLLRRRQRIIEVPIHYTPRVYSAGKKIRWYHGLRIVWTIVTCRFLPLSSAERTLCASRAPRRPDDEGAGIPRLCGPGARR